MTNHLPYNLNQRALLIQKYFLDLFWRILQDEPISLSEFSSSGRLSTARKMDREATAQFSLQITATDGKGKVS